MGQFKEMLKFHLREQRKKIKELWYAFKHLKKLKKGYTFFMDNSILVLNILSKQFKLTHITVVDRFNKKSTTTIKKDIEDLKTYDMNQIRGTILVPATRYLYGFRCLNLYYMQLLDKLIQTAGGESYEEIDYADHKKYILDTQKYIKYFD